MKRLLILIAVASILVSCHSNGSKIDENKMTKGEWLLLLFEEFGMSYEEEQTINWLEKNNPYYDSVQTGLYWDVIDNQTFNITSFIDYEYLINTLYKTMYIESTDSFEDMYTTLFEMGIVSIDRKEISNQINKEEAIQMLETAKQMYTSLEVINPSFYFNDSNEVKEVNDYQFINQNQIQLDNLDIKIGDIILVEGQYYHIKGINDNLYTIEVASFDEIIENIELQDTFYPDLSQSMINEGLESSNLSFHKPTTSILKDNAKLMNTSIKHLDFTIGDLKVTGNLSKNNMNLKVSGHLNDDIELLEELSISNLKITTKLDMDKFKIKEGLLQIDYTTSNDISLSTKKYLDSSKLKVQDINELKDRIKTDLFTATNTSKSFDLFTLDIPIASTGKIITIKMVVGINITVKGELSLSITSNQTNGVEIINNKVRFISQNTKEVEPLIEGGIEASAFLKLYLTCLTKKIMNIAVNFGLKAKASLSLHFVDLGLKEVEEINIDSDMLSPPYEISIENQFFDTCLDVSLSWLFTISAGEKGTLMNTLGISYSYDFFRNKDPIFKIVHIENHTVVKECQRKYIFHDINNESKQLNISSYREILEVGETKTLTINQLHQDYSFNDLIWNSSNPSIATVDNGIIKAIDYGETIITVKTKDNLYYAECYISVEPSSYLRSHPSFFFFIVKHLYHIV